MKDKIGLIIGLIFGILGTIGGWYIFLIMLGVVDYPSYSLLSLIVIWAGLSTVIVAQLFGGPIIMWDAIKNYRSRGE